MKSHILNLRYCCDLIHIKGGLIFQITTWDLLFEVHCACFQRCQILWHSSFCFWIQENIDKNFEIKGFNTRLCKALYLHKDHTAVLHMTTYSSCVGCFIFLLPLLEKIQQLLLALTQILKQICLLGSQTAASQIVIRNRFP